MSHNLNDIEQQGVISDPWLAENPDSPVFGLNLACAYPFSGEVEQAYSALATKLADLDPAVYLYPAWETHVTIMTFINFNLHQRPSPARLAEFHAVAEQLIQSLNLFFARAEIKPFQLEFQPPVLTRKAAIFPIVNPTGEIARIRQHVGELLQQNETLRQSLAGLGLNVPGIIHSTFLRFRRAPENLRRFLDGFQTIASTTHLGSLAINELFLTAETKPYMRQGAILHRFSLK
jgi:hypothetical protein